MKLEAVTVCVDYADFLAATLPHNKHLFDRMVIVTTPSDKRTQELCEYWHVQCIQTEAFFDRGDKFNKARGINVGFDNLSMDDWVLHLDADIYLPPRARSFLEIGNLNPQALYGVDRLMCQSYEAWGRYLGRPKGYQAETFVHADSFPLGARMARGDEGYCPLGYFQLFNPRHSGRDCYPEQHGSIDRSDIEFTRLWQPHLRRLIAEFVAVHPESEPVMMGANWNGRRTMEFGPRESEPVTDKGNSLLDGLAERAASAGRQLLMNLQNRRR